MAAGDGFRTGQAKSLHGDRVTVYVGLKLQPALSGDTCRVELRRHEAESDSSPLSGSLPRAGSK